MISDKDPGTTPVRRSAWSGAEARGFEPRKGVNPNRISSPVPAPKPDVRRSNPLQPVQVRAGLARKAAKAAAIRRKRLVPARCQHGVRRLP
jgi:hypothetical protein